MNINRDRFSHCGAAALRHELGDSAQSSLSSVLLSDRGLTERRRNKEGPRERQIEPLAWAPSDRVRSGGAQQQVAVGRCITIASRNQLAGRTGPGPSRVLHNTAHMHAVGGAPLWPTSAVVAAVRADIARTHSCSRSRSRSSDGGSDDNKEQKEAITLRPLQ
jgi:hypothetical protein